MKNTYLINTRSNLHVGAGSSNYGVIDNLVQRDPTDTFPTVFASSLKGALREFFKDTYNSVSKTNEIFGGAENGRSTFVLSEAHLLGLPVRSDKYPYLMATSPYLLRKFLAVTCEDFGLNVDQKQENALKELGELKPDPGTAYWLSEGEPGELTIEDLEKVVRHKPSQESTDVLGRLLGKAAPLLLLSETDMQYLAGDYALPVLARNSLENGQSENLWYEQVVPRQTVFYFVLDEEGFVPDKEKKPDEVEYSVTALLNKTPLIQLGANASIGYGKCKIAPLDLNKS